MYTRVALEKYTEAEKICLAKLTDLVIARSAHAPDSAAYLVLTIDMHKAADLYAEYREMKLRSAYT